MRVSSKSFVWTLLGLIVLCFAPLAVSNKVSAACAVNGELGSVNYGVVTPEAGDYKIWVRIRPESKAANSVFLEIDGGECLTVGDDESLPDKNWSWIDHSGQGDGKKLLTHKFESAGNHNIKVIGNESGVGVDRILLLAASDGCVPSNEVAEGFQPGDNCKTSEAVAAPADSSGGSVTESSPASTSILKKVLIGGVALVLTALAVLLYLKKFRNKKFKPIKVTDYIHK